jgi:hypothetical protein
MKMRTLLMAKARKHLNLNLGNNWFVDLENFGKNDQINFEETEISIIFVANINLTICQQKIYRNGQPSIYRRRRT